MKERDSQFRLSRRDFLKLSSAGTALEFAGLVKTKLPDIPYGKLMEIAYQAYLKNIIINGEEIGGREKYQEPLLKGLGWVSRHPYTVSTCAVRGKELRKLMDLKGQTYDDLTDYQKNIFDITTRGTRSIKNSLDPAQFEADPRQVMNSGQYAGLVATRSPEDIGRPYYVYGVDSPRAEPNFVGRVLVVDCPRQTDWEEKLSDWEYHYLAWEKSPLDWIGDFPDEIMPHLPLGYSQNENNINEGRPGVLMVAGEIFESFHQPLR